VETELKLDIFDSALSTRSLHESLFDSKRLYKKSLCLLYIFDSANLIDASLIVLNLVIFMLMNGIIVNNAISILNSGKE
jgi:hypothetical protein